MYEKSEPRFIFIFDLDGLLIDTSPFHFRAWKNIMGKFGFEFTESFNKQLKGMDRIQSLEKILIAANLKLSETEKKKLAEEKNELYLTMISTLNEIDVMPGVEDFIKEAIRIKIPMAVGSGGKNAMILLEKTGLKKYFDAIVDGNMISKSKPDPEVFLVIAEKLAYNPKQCIVFEDSRLGVSAGKSAGMFVVGIGDPEYLDKADLVFPSFTLIRAHEIVNWFSIV